MTREWSSIVDEQRQQPYFSRLTDFVSSERDSHTIHPMSSHVFAALEATPFATTRVVLLGQDPYHGTGQAHGLAFSVQPGVPLPPSLRNIMKERESDLGLAQPTHGDLSAWCRHGVLLLNSTLTVRHGHAGSHSGHGWEVFTDSLLQALNEKTERVVFLLWGVAAQRKRELITNSRHVILEAPHPSPLSAHRGFFGCRHFSLTNDALEDDGQAPVDWAT